VEPVRNTGTVRPRETGLDLNDPDPHGAEPRRVRPRLAAALEATVPLSPRRAMPGDMEAGPGAAAPRNAALPSSPLPDLNASQLGSPGGAERLQPPEATFDREVASRHYPKLTAYLERLEKAYLSDDIPHVDDIKDIDHLGDMIAGLNAADPALKLEYYKAREGDDEQFSFRDSPLADRLAAELGKGTAWRGILDIDDHRTALSIKCSSSSNDVSMVLVNSVGFDLPDIEQVRGQWRTALEELRTTLQQKLSPSARPVRLDMVFTGSDVQKPREGCCIFALSAAKKMASDPAIEGLHRSTLQDLASGTLRPSVASVSADVLLPPSFFKHTTSRSVVGRYLETRRLDHALAVRRGAGDGPGATPDPFGSPDAPVNKKGQSLQQRFEGHLVNRADRDRGVNRTYSNSYEAKRIEIIKTALAHLTADKR
jgi:hypothetical protein